MHFWEFRYLLFNSVDKKEYVLNSIGKDTYIEKFDTNGYGSGYLLVGNVGGFPNIYGVEARIGITSLGRTRTFASLKDNIKISSGEGTKANPFILTLN